MPKDAKACLRRALTHQRRACELHRPPAATRSARAHALNCHSGGQRATHLASNGSARTESHSAARASAEKPDRAARERLPLPSMRSSAFLSLPVACRECHQGRA